MTMNMMTNCESYDMERAIQIDTLRQEMVYMESELPAIKADGDYKSYTALMRMYLATERRYLQLVKELEADSAQPESDALLDFMGQEA